MMTYSDIKEIRKQILKSIHN